ncbi:hypothetical protein KAFR_0A07750 [Kazachstania africana CBS 2517]|uniref:Histone chaperone RTT106 n=1 Tax=Kazachstania africana (strain ATCC 22294 / BCRC 22015 / CBS 2517 / CECT 1963 / NBRC 1671 / NRRL Y-8276) TaxID=1071382 RepID=H2APA9_KAZAF|nr:hypothetical protein KAFR_0A07750 [Kazachstania africana CBS 2517]CCF56209.1 hypothetical protein KAFR_0A07750 [Kazachstania africana CBS 2517]
MSESFLNHLPEELRGRVVKITSVLPNSLSIFQDVYNFALDEVLESKRKQVKSSTSINGKHGEQDKVEESDIILKLDNVSVLSPLRRKLSLALHLSSTTKKPVLSLLKEDHSIEFSITDLKSSINMASFLPVPEKQGIMYLFVSYKQSNNPKYTEPLLITLNKESTLQQFVNLGIVSSDEKDFKKCVDYLRKQAIITGFRINDPFASESNAFHVDCHRSTKEGVLYFLSDHIIFGFRKPILLFNSSDIESITYSSITRLTFNVTLITKTNEKYEFSMIDQNEYGKIDEYAKKREVIDKSMSDELKAKKMNQSHNEGQSALKEASEQIEVNINNIPMDSDDENDENFEGESELSDGSDDSDEDSGEGSEAEEVVDEQQEEGEEKEEEGKFSIPHNDAIKQEIPVDVKKEMKDLHENSPDVVPADFEDIPIEIDEDDDSGVEYD